MKESWFWIIIVSLILIIVLPLVIVWFILALPPELSFVATILVIVTWGVVAGYKDWIIHKRNEEKKQRQSENI
jgi:uncharacterized membrane protein